MGSGGFGVGKVLVRLREDVNSCLDEGVAAVVIEQSAGNFLELLVADDLRIFRCNFVAHGRSKVS